MDGLEHLLRGPGRLAVLAGVLALGSIGLTLAMTGAGLPFIASGLLAAVAAGFVQYAALRLQKPPEPVVPANETDNRLDTYRAHTAALRHDLRGVLSPALMVSDRLVNHQDPAVQRAGQTVVRSIERATALIVSHRDALAPEQDNQPASAPAEMP